MPGPTHPRDEQDPRESTVDLPRVKHSSQAASLSGPAGNLTPVSPVPAAAPVPPIPTAAPTPLAAPFPPAAPILPVTPSRPVAAASHPPAAAAGTVSRTAEPRPEAPAAPADRIEPERDASRFSRPPAGSLADLRSRLARLPDGHPSSPYDDGGTARPLPIRIKQLELGLPAPEREHADAEPPAELLLTGHGRAPELANPSEPVFDARIAGPGPGLPAGTGLPPGELGPSELAPNGNGRSHAVRPARPQWQDPYATPPAGNGHSEHDRPGDHADLALGPWPAGNEPAGGINGGSRPADVQPRLDLPARPDVTPRPDTGVPRDRTAQHHVPAEPGTGRPNDGIQELTERVMTACRTAEGQNLFGAYGSSGLTPAIRRIAAQLPYGGLAAGSEAYSLKSADRFAAKLARLVARNPGRPAEDLAWAIYDAIRYAFAFEPPDYTDGTWLVHRILKATGFELEARRNRWENPEYKGIWTRWRDPAHELAFEIQFHTPASWAVLQRTHEAYMRITDPGIPPGERARLRVRQVSAAVEAKPPPRCMEIADFRSEASRREAT